MPYRVEHKEKLKKNTIIYSTVRPNLKHFGILENPPDNIILSTGFTTIDVYDKTVDAKFLYYAITQEHFTNYLHTIASSKVTSYPSINPDDLGNLVLTIPNKIEEQKKIAAVLSALDAKIELNNHINTELEEMARTLFNYWFVQFNFPDSNGTPYKSSGGKMVWNAELKRDIPEGWKVRRLNEFTEVSNEQVNPNDDPEKEFKHYSIPAYDFCGSYQIEKGGSILSNKFAIKNTDILVSKLNPWFSRVIYATDDIDLISSTEFVVWREKNIGKKNFLYMIARDHSFVSFCTQSASGTSNSHKRVNPTVMMKYLVAYNEQVSEDFGNILGSTIKMYAKNQSETNELTKLRDWLLPILMNGQVKVI